MNVTFSIKNWLYLLIGGIIVFTTSCKDLLPTDREEIGGDSRFTKMRYEPILGRTTVFSNNFYKGSTSFPATFKIVNPRKFDGEPAPELKDTFPVLVWKEAYTGDEQSIEEIEAKRATEYHPVWEIRPHSGQFVMWQAAKDAFILAQPDSGYVFDVEVSNSGGRRYYRNLTLRPFRARAYEPNNADKVLGQGTGLGAHPTAMVNVDGAHYDRGIGSGSVDVYFHKRGNGNSLTFKFLDTLYKPIDPANFGTTDWENLVHGFDMKMTDTTVTYQVAYPIPLTEKETKYTTKDGKMAHLEFKYSRIGFNHIRKNARIEFNFEIYEPGDWNIVFVFKSDNPKFEDE